MSKEIFISHSTADGHLINILIEFLNSLGIKNDNIFCTSISGTLEGGKSFVDQIKDNVQGSKVVIFLLSERFFLSNFCLAELGAAWALNQNILPIIVPPISTIEYNNTPLIGIQALNVGNTTFPKELLNNLVKKNVILSDNINDKEKVFNDFNSKIKIETNILRKDLRGFYVARLIEKQSRKVNCQQQISCKLLFGSPCTTTFSQNEIMWKLNGLFDIEENPNIREHWIDAGLINLVSTKLQFKLGKVIEQGNNYKLFEIKTFYELP